MYSAQLFPFDKQEVLASSNVVDAPSPLITAAGIGKKSTPNLLGPFEPFISTIIWGKLAGLTPQYPPGHPTPLVWKWKTKSA